MTYTITNDCISCDRCLSVCPTGAIQKDSSHYSIDPTICNNCVGHYGVPQCASICPTSHGCIPGTSFAFNEPELKNSSDYWQRWFAMYEHLLCHLNDKHRDYWNSWFNSYSHTLSHLLAEHKSVMVEANNS